MFDPQKKSQLADFTLAAKKVIFNAERMKKFLPMMDTKTGAMQAVLVVMAIIEQARPIPPDLKIFLSVNIYKLMVDWAQDVTGQKASRQIVQDVAIFIMENVLNSSRKRKKANPAQPAAAKPTGLIASQGV